MNRTSFNSSLKKKWEGFFIHNNPGGQWNKIGNVWYVKKSKKDCGLKNKINK